MTEWLDVYDCRGRATGRVQPRDQVGGEEDYYLTVRIWVRDAGGRLLLTRRQGDRVWYPALPRRGRPALWPPAGSWPRRPA